MLKSVLLKAKIDNHEYEDVKQFKVDMDTMFSNAKKYNERGSQVYEDAIALQVASSNTFTHDC